MQIIIYLVFQKDQQLFSFFVCTETFFVKLKVKPISFALSFVHAMCIFVQQLLLFETHRRKIFLFSIIKDLVTSFTLIIKDLVTSLTIYRVIFCRTHQVPIYPCYFPSPSPQPVSDFLSQSLICHIKASTPQPIHFLKAHDVSYPTSDRNRNTKTKTMTKKPREQLKH